MIENLSTSITNVFTVDVEEYFNVESFSRFVRKEEWCNYPQRVRGNTERLLKILGSFQVQGTFFVLGWIAESYPELIKKIYDDGHEVASHGYDHRMINFMTRDDFRKDVRRTKEILEKITGSEITGYRAPTFSVMEKTSWAHNILFEEGYRYSSSVFPISHDRYGWPGFGYDPRRVVQSENGGLWEIPMSVWKCGPIRIPYGGGGYLRAYPLFFSKALIRKNHEKGRHGIVYIHPWELDDEHPYVKAPLLTRMRHHVGIYGMEQKLKAILQIFNFDSMTNFLSLYLSRARI